MLFYKRLNGIARHIALMSTGQLIASLAFSIPCLRDYFKQLKVKMNALEIYVSEIGVLVTTLMATSPFMRSAPKSFPTRIQTEVTIKTAYASM